MVFAYRVLERVFERHIEMNKHRLDEVSIIETPSYLSIIDSTLLLTDIKYGKYN